MRHFLNRGCPRGSVVLSYPSQPGLVNRRVGIGLPRGEILNF